MARLPSALPLRGEKVPLGPVLTRTENPAACAASPRTLQEPALRTERPLVVAAASKLLSRARPQVVAAPVPPCAHAQTPTPHQTARAHPGPPGPQHTADSLATPRPV
jgi:hypothetical protein